MSYGIISKSPTTSGDPITAKTIAGGLSMMPAYLTGGLLESPITGGLFESPKPGVSMTPKDLNSSVSPGSSVAPTTSPTLKTGNGICPKSGEAGHGGTVYVMAVESTTTGMAVQSL